MNVLTKKPRILTLDLLRGYFLTVIIIDHIFRFPNIFEIVTGRGELWVSAAEGFFIISGLLVGYLKQPARVLFARSLKIYLLSVGFTLFFTFLGHFMQPGLIMTGIWPDGSVLKILNNTFFLSYTYGWTDFLPYYAVYLLLAPVSLLLIRKHRSWLVLLASLALWLIRGNNHFLAWQILFFAGMILGSVFGELRIFVTHLSVRSKQILSTSIIGIFLLTLFLSIYFVFIKNLNLTWFDKDTLAPGRLFLAWIWFAAFYIMFSSKETVINRLTYGVLKLFGQNSLLVYCSHAVILFPINTIFPYGNYIESSLLSLFILIAVYLVCVSKKVLSFKDCRMIFSGLYPKNQPGRGM